MSVWTSAIFRAEGFRRFKNLFSDLKCGVDASAKAVQSLVV